MLAFSRTAAEWQAGGAGKASWGTAQIAVVIMRRRSLGGAREALGGTLGEQCQGRSERSPMRRSRKDSCFAQREAAGSQLRVVNERIAELPRRCPKC